MKKTIIKVGIYLILFCFLLVPVTSGQGEYEELIKSSYISVTIDQDDNTDFQEKVIFENPTDHLIELDIHIWMVWPFNTDKGFQYSLYPFNKGWERGGEEILVSEEGAEFFKLHVSLASKEKTGITFRAIVALEEGYITKNNDTYTFQIKGIVEGETKEIEVKIPTKRPVFPILFSEKLKINETLPLYVNEEEEFDYRIFRWDENFFTYYHTGLGTNLTMNEIKIVYGYQFDWDLPINFFAGVIVTAITGLIIKYSGKVIKSIFKKDKESKRVKRRK